MLNENPFRLSSEIANMKEKSINGKIYGSGDISIIFSNMDTNEQNEWRSIIGELISDRLMGLTYDYPKHMDDQSKILEEVISFVRSLGSKDIVLIGASRGGVASIKYGTENSDWLALSEIFKLAPLGTREPEKLKIASENSHTVCSAYVDQKIIGFGRAISDGQYQSAIYDVVVLPEFQNQGVGKMIMGALLEKLPDRKKNQWIDTP